MAVSVTDKNKYNIWKCSALSYLRVPGDRMGRTLARKPHLWNLVGLCPGCQCNMGLCCANMYK